VFADRICYVMKDELSSDHIPNEAAKELYLAFLEKQKARFALRIYTPRKILLLVVESQEKRDHIVNTISRHLQGLFNTELWSEKEKAAKVNLCLLIYAHL
jgi:hypothetical protein